MKLYYAPRTRSGRVRWLLEELAEVGPPIAFQLHRLDLAKGEHKSDAYRAIHPHGVVPALCDGEVTVIESAAICLYLADKFIDHGLAPPLGAKERGPYYQWIIYAMATIEGQIIRHLEIGKLPEADRPAALAESQKNLDEIAQVLTRALENKTFLVGDRFSAADVVVGGVVVWGVMLKLFDKHPAVIAYSKRLGDRPASRRARAD